MNKFIVTTSLILSSLCNISIAEVPKNNGWLMSEIVSSEKKFRETLLHHKLDFISSKTTSNDLTEFLSNSNLIWTNKMGHEFTVQGLKDTKAKIITISFTENKIDEIKIVYKDGASLGSSFLE